MGLRQDEFQKARRISRAIQEHLEATGANGLRSTDVYDILRRKKIVEEDLDQGVKFRRFLKKLKDLGYLGLIPQCKPQPHPHIKEFTEWYFYRVEKKESQNQNSKNTSDKVFSISIPIISDKEIETKGLKNRVKNFPKIDDSKLTSNQKEIRSRYPRAYEIWSSAELDLARHLWEKWRKLEPIAKLLERQPSAVQSKLNLN